MPWFNYQTTHLPRLSHRVAATTIWNLQIPLLGSPPYGAVLFVMSLLLGRHPPESSATMLTNVAFSRSPLRDRLSDALGLTGQLCVYLTYSQARICSILLQWTLGVQSIASRFDALRCLSFTTAWRVWDHDESYTHHYPLGRPSEGYWEELRANCRPLATGLHYVLSRYTYGVFTPTRDTSCLYAPTLHRTPTNKLYFIFYYIIIILH